MKTFIQKYEQTVSNTFHADFQDNWDTDRFGPEIKENRKLPGFLESWLKRSRWYEKRKSDRIKAVGLDHVQPYLSELEWLHQSLADEESRRWLVLLAAYRALGHRRIRLPTNNPEFWKVRNTALEIPHGQEEIDPQHLGWKIHERSLKKLGYPINVFCLPGAFYHTFVLRQYHCETAEGVIACEKGDIVIDAGGCYGDSALYFAHQVGPQGRVASFEFLPINVSIFRRNMALNPNLAERIRLYESPLYSENNRELFVIGSGPGTRVVPETSDPKAYAVRTTMVDDLLSRGDLPRVNFLKMDIEGAELEALKGSEQTLRKFRPKLAITVYHDFKDFWTIPRYINSLGLNYRFYLRHFTIHAEETVLFAH